MCHKFKRKNGFTLIEVFLALFITAILITILSVVFNTGLRAYRQGKDLLEITRKGQLILGQMTRELSGAMVQKDYIPFIGIDNGISDSVYFMAPVDNSGKIDLCEIGYLRDGNDMKRYFHPISGAVDEYPKVVANYAKGTQNTFCTNITRFNLRYRPVGGSWQDSWSSSTTELPEMIEVSVKIQGEYPTSGPTQSKTFTTWIYLPNSTDNP